MQRKPQELIVREHERYACALDAMLSVESQRVVLASAVTDGGAGGDMLRVRIVDCSAGGVGIQTPVFLPRACRVRLHVFHPSAGDATPAPGWLLEASLRIQRVSMVSRDPQYYLGAAFVDLDGPQTEAVGRLLGLLASTSPAMSGRTPC